MNRQTMTPVDNFANNAMNGIVSSLVTPEGYDNISPKEIATESYELADEMMKEKFKRDTNLCNDCTKCIAKCSSNPTFGLGLGHDNIIKCSSYKKKDNHKIRTFFRVLYFKIRNKLNNKL